MAKALLEAVRGLRVADPGLGVKPLLARLREQQPDLAAGTKEVREALAALKAEGETRKAGMAAPDTAAAAAATLPAADESSAPAHEAPSLACVGCARMPSKMGDGRLKHPVCPKCVTLKLPTTYFCSINCPGNPVAWNTHVVFHKGLKKQQKLHEDGGAWQQRDRETAERQARNAAQSGDKYEELLAEGGLRTSKEDWRRAARAYREAIALRPDEPSAYYNLGNALSSSGHDVEAAQRYLEAKERYPVGSEDWAEATACAFDLLRQKECAEVAKPEWWNDEGLKVLSARVVRVAPNEVVANNMRAEVLCGQCDGWKALPRSSAEFKEAATHYERAVALCNAPAVKAQLAGNAGWCRRQAEAM